MIPREDVSVATATPIPYSINALPNADTAPGVVREPLRVVHFVDSAGATDRLWGKENVIVALMEAQRASGHIEPELITFTPGLLNEKMKAAGFPVHSLETRHHRFSTSAWRALHRLLAVGRPAIVHAHEYKANIMSRLSRASGARMNKLVATCHGWVDHSPQLDVYYAFDRLTAVYSDAVTVTDPAMLRRFPPFRPRCLVFVQNAVMTLPVPHQTDRTNARSQFGFNADDIVIGSLGRLTTNKGVIDILEAARRTVDAGIIWAIAGSGPLTEHVRRCSLPNVRYVGYQPESTNYLAALDVYVQASYFEGLSLSLLESMRAALPSIATRAGATEFAVRDQQESLIVSAGNVDAIVGAALQLQADRSLAMKLGSAARVRFEEAFSIQRQHAAFMNVYSA